MPDAVKTAAGRKAPRGPSNIDRTSIDSFGDEWSRFDQAALSPDEHRYIFDKYFSIFPWATLGENAEGFDMGCGSGRWAKLVAPRVGHLNCIDPSPAALGVAQRKLSAHPNVTFILGSADNPQLGENSQDFGYSLGVLHHIPDTLAALKTCVSLLKPGAPFLLYLYYRFDNKPVWYRWLWRLSEMLRWCISRLPPVAKQSVTDPVALFVYYPLARIAFLGERAGCNMKNFPLYGYRHTSLYTMRTDSRDRFGTPLEQRYTKSEITAMMQAAGLTDIVFSEAEPFWCGLGHKVAAPR